jgi:hypothetical protein
MNKEERPHQYSSRIRRAQRTDQAESETQTQDPLFGEDACYYCVHPQLALSLSEIRQGRSCSETEKRRRRVEGVTAA